MLLDSNAAEIDINPFTSISVAELPADSTDIISALRNERSDPIGYLRFALFCLRKGNKDAFRQLLEAAINISKENGAAWSSDAHDPIMTLIYVALASFYISKARHDKKDKRKMDSSFEEATYKLNELSAQGKTEDELVFLTKGVLFIARSELMNAGYQFDNALKKNKNNIPALLGKACIAYGNRLYVEALVLYQHILRLWPSGPASLRLALGLCFFKLNDYPSASLCFKRAVKMDPNNVDILVSLALLDLNSKHDMTVNEALHKFKKAYSLNRSHPIVLNHLAAHFFFRQEYAKAEALATNAYHSSEDDELRAESCYFLGRIYHDQNNFTDAFRYYLQATKLNPNYPLANFGLGQMYLNKGDMTSAIECFEKVLQRHPENYETLKLLSSMYANSMKDYKKAGILMQKVMELCPDDLETWIEYASFTEQSDPAEAIKAYKHVLTIMESSADFPASPEIYNNIGVLLQLEGSMSDAEQYIDRAFAECSSILSSRSASADHKHHYQGLLTTIKFNKARLYEDKYLYSKAEEIYRDILKSNPFYIDCFLRLGMMAQSLGHYSEASDLYKDAIGLEENNKEAWTLLATLQASTKAITPARKTFERILSKIDKRDHYSLVFLGNIYTQIAYHEQKRSKLWVQNLHRAAEFFQKCLLLDSRNFYAVNGLAIIAAIKGHFLPARDAFLQIRQSETNFSDCWLNMAHTYMEEGHFSAALNLYEHVMHKFCQGKDVSLMLYIAKALFCIGKHNKDASFFLKAISWLQRALLLHSGDHSIRFNIALCQQEYAVVIIQKDRSLRTLQDMDRAIRELDVAAFTFEVLGDALWVPDQHKLHMPYDYKVAKQRAKYCQSLRNNAQSQYQKQNIEEARRLERMEQLRRSREAELMQARTKEEEEARQRLEEELKLDEIRRITTAKAKEVQSKLTYSWPASSTNADESMFKNNQEDFEVMDDDDREAMEEEEMEEENEGDDIVGDAVLDDESEEVVRRSHNINVLREETTVVHEDAGDDIAEEDDHEASEHRKNDRQESSMQMVYEEDVDSLFLD